MRSLAAIFIGLGLVLGFCLNTVMAAHGISVRSSLSDYLGLSAFGASSPMPESTFVAQEQQSLFYRAQAPLYAAFPHHADVAMFGDSLVSLADWRALLPGIDVANRGISGD